MNHYFNIIESPIGPLTTVVNESEAVLAVHFGAKEDQSGVRSAARTGQLDRQLAEYFARTRTTFELNLEPRGTAFQHQVWELLVQIPFGETRSYGQLAKELGRPGSSRAVGRANATNPIAIIVPCHRVIGASGSLTGYAGGLDMKSSLLEFEQAGAGNLFSLVS